MSLTNGTRLGAYEIVAPIGAGGTEEVYVAEDTKLHRNIALELSLRLQPPLLANRVCGAMTSHLWRTVE
jgi:hypothetical protein